MFKSKLNGGGCGGGCSKNQLGGENGDCGCGHHDGGCGGGSCS